MKANASETGNECFQISDSSSQCCVANMGTLKSCLPISKTGKEYETISSYGYSDLTQAQFVINSKFVGNIEMKCSNNNPVGEAIRNKVSICGNLPDSSLNTCSKMNDNDIQCCYLESALPAGIISSINGCLGAHSKMKLPSYSAKMEGNLFTLACGITEEEKKVMETCGNTIPLIKDDCTKLSSGSMTCRYALKDKTTPLCMGMKGDINMAKNLKLMQNLQNIEIMDSSQITAEVKNSSGYIKSIWAIVITLFVLLF